MGIAVYGRRSRRRFERVTGERIVWAAGEWLTSIEHGHWRWDTDRDMWWPLAWASNTDCGVPLSSCGVLFGTNEHGAARDFMLGSCSVCLVGSGEPHRWDCQNLLVALGSVDPDYWPRPVHRPLWMDDKRRGRTS